LRSDSHDAGKNSTLAAYADDVLSGKSDKSASRLLFRLRHKEPHAKNYGAKVQMVLEALGGFASHLRALPSAFQMLGVISC
jgi:hypothetical protein